MFEIDILAALTSKWDIAGVFCIAAIPCIIIVLMVYKSGPVSGSTSCLIFWVIAVLVTGDAGDYGSGMTNITPNKTYIANKSQTKMIERYKFSINDSHCIFGYWDQATTTTLDDVAYFIPAEEMYIEDGCYKMKSTGKCPTDDDYYLYDETIDPINAPAEIGGWGVPQWVYHPAAPCYIFGIGGLPALLAGMFIASKLRD